ncbi:MAG TPA: hypothetical protein VL049_28295 [Candidatus Dormibacteraeota bacterium]|nr:hypothetical protein [Candidatus Dormibacteraeota bacterium]
MGRALERRRHPPARGRRRAPGHRKTPRQRLEGLAVDVDVIPGDVVRVTTTGDPGLPFATASATVGDQVPAWESMTPADCGG